MSHSYSIASKNSPHKHICTINLSWPEEMSFSEMGSSKKAAMLHAARKCLVWLNQTHRITNSTPKLYAHEEIKSLLSDPVKIDLDSKFNNQIKLMLETYYHVSFRINNNVYFRILYKLFS